MNEPKVTRERMRADIAEILDQPVAVVEDGMNLLDLGLDSMRIMELAERWTEESGGFVDFASLAEHPELGAWWNVVSGQSG